jgi:hypothetical protein
LQAFGIAGGVEAVGGSWVVADLLTGPSVVGGFAVAEIEAGFQFGAETVAEVGGDTFAAGCALVLVAVRLRVGEADVVVGVSQYLPELISRWA